MSLYHYPAWWSVLSQARALDLVRRICAVAPLRRPMTPGGRPMHVRITNAGPVGWWSDEAGYRYAEAQPDGRPWADAHPWLLEQARAVALRSGERFEPDTILINWYEPDASLSTHRDEQERDRQAPIVSFSLGAPATFTLRGSERESPVSTKVRLKSGDALVMKPPARNWYHSIDKIHEPDVFDGLDMRGRISILVRRAR